MSSKNILLYFTLCLFVNLFYARFIRAGEELENWAGNSHKSVVATKPVYPNSSRRERPSIFLKSNKNSLLQTTPPIGERNYAAEKIERALNKQHLTFPVQLCARDLYNILQKGSTQLKDQGLLATVIKQENTSTLEISKKSKITAVLCFEVTRLQANQNPLVGRRKSDSRTGKYALYQEEDLIEGACLEIYFSWPKKEYARK